jgi:IMP dehydrogenase
VKYPAACKDSLGRLRVGAAVGVSRDTIDRADALVAAHVDVLVIDTAHGHSQGVLDMVARLRERHTDVQIVAGNVATADATRALIDRGVDASSRHRRRIDLHHARGRRHRRADDYRRGGVRERGRRA